MSDTQAPGAFPITEARVLIAGGTAGVGYASARKLASLGAPQITLNGRNPERGEAARARLQEEFPDCKVHYQSADVADTQAVVNMVKSTEEAMGGIDVLLISTTTSHPYPELFHNIDINDIQSMTTSHILPYFLLARAVHDGMKARNRGAIINIASDAGKAATPGETIIGGLMAGIMMFTRTLAMELKRSHIRVNCITPSIIEDTDLHDVVMAREFPQKLFSKAKKMASLGVVTAGEMAELVAFLAGPETAKMTGQTISLNGGISAA
ncbi:SDR family NAD(P)-dependent oxidoreductase [Mesobacterium pallidum]|uniref:SDR family NAD(P)-dependent oxidoreductase n=1 Tax=Mesobacterium pallidum TaxID=2872037 RepID=UPI001EE19BA5|nr:SDR family oxidoreductase [Mesobacterium pallidum]